MAATLTLIDVLTLFGGFARFHCVVEPLRLALGACGRRENGRNGVHWPLNVIFLSTKATFWGFVPTGPEVVEGRDLNRLGACTKRNYFPRCLLTGVGQLVATCTSPRCSGGEHTLV